MSEEEKKRECSLPVQGRVDIRRLAEMDVHFADQGIYIATMSQLLAWTVDLCSYLLSLDNRLTKTFESVEDAYMHLELRGLKQESMKKRSVRKILTARGYESLRGQGADPAYEDPGRFKQLHGHHNVKASPYNRIEVPEEDRSDILDELQRGIDMGRKEEIEATKKKGREAVEWEVDEKTGLTVCKVQSSDSGIVTQDDLDKWEKEKLEKQKKLYEESKVSSDEPRKMSDEELDKKGEEIKKKDKERAKLEKEMINPDR